MSGKTSFSNIEETPGPGAYEYGKTSKGPSFTLSGRTEFVNHTDTPGPGAYTTSNEVGKGPKYSIFGRPTTKEVSSLPGTFTS